MTADEVLLQVNATFSDGRTQYCRLELAEDQPGRWILTGAVLDRATLSRALDALAQELPGLTASVEQVLILDAQPGRFCAGVNLTGLFAQPSWLAEQVSQLLNGWPLDVLLEQDRWRFVRQADGYLGWAYGPYLVPLAGCAFTDLVCWPEVRLLAEPSPDAGPATRIPGGTAVVVDAAEREWRHVALAGNAPVGLRLPRSGPLPRCPRTNPPAARR